MALRTSAQAPGGYSAPGGGFGTDTKTMDTAAGYVRHIGDVMKTAVNNMLLSVGSELQGKWDTPSASSAYQNAQNNWNDQYMNDLMKAINEIADGLDNSARIYNQAELDSAAGIPTY